MTGNPNMMLWSLATKQHLLNIYVGAGPSSGFEVAQRMTREIGDVLCEMHGRDKAAVLVYGVADSIATKGELPKLPALPEPVTLPVPAKTGFDWAHANLLLIGIVIGLFVSEIAREVIGP